VASAGEIEDAVQELRAALLGIGYLNPAQPDEVLGELRGVLVRARPTPREVTLLRGVARQVAWAGKKARGGPAIG
jgi:tRNA/rRNA methyltransferase